MGKPRKGMTVRKVPLRSAEAAASRVGGTADERLALVRKLSEAAWKASGRPFPSYDRAHMPIRIVKLGERRDRD